MIGIHTHKKKNIDEINGTKIVAQYSSHITDYNGSYIYFKGFDPWYARHIPYAMSIEYNEEINTSFIFEQDQINLFKSYVMRFWDDYNAITLIPFDVNLKNDDTESSDKYFIITEVSAGFKDFSTETSLTSGVAKIPLEYLSEDNINKITVTIYCYQELPIQYTTRLISLQRLSDFFAKSKEVFLNQLCERDDMIENIFGTYSFYKFSSNIDNRRELAEASDFPQYYANVLSSGQIADGIGMVEALAGFFKLREFPPININTKYVTNMDSLFYNNQSLETIDTSWINTSNVTNMNRMFSCLYSIKDLDLSNFDTTNVIDMSDMFAGCTNLETIDISSFDTSKVQKMSSMFYECINLKRIIGTIDLTSIIVQNNNGIINMFKRTDTSKFTEKVKFTNVPEGLDILASGINKDMYEIVS